MPKPLKFQTLIQPIKILRSFTEHQDEAAHVAGWGKIVGKSSKSSIFKARLEEHKDGKYDFVQTTKCHENIINLQTPDECNR